MKEYMNASLAPKKRAELLLNEMTLDEKMAQITGVFAFPGKEDRMAEFLPYGIGQISSLEFRSVGSMKELSAWQRKLQQISHRCDKSAQRQRSGISHKDLCGIGIIQKKAHQPSDHRARHSDEGIDPHHRAHPAAAHNGVCVGGNALPEDEGTQGAVVGLSLGGQLMPPLHRRVLHPLRLELESLTQDIRGDIEVPGSQNRVDPSGQQGVNGGADRSWQAVIEGEAALQPVIDDAEHSAAQLIAGVNGDAVDLEIAGGANHHRVAPDDAGLIVKNLGKSGIRLPNHGGGAAGQLFQ